MSEAGGAGVERHPIFSLQVMRGLAALSVVAFHTSLIMGKSQYGSMHAFERATTYGWMGVNFFFVLSGFIIFYAHAKDIGHPQRVGAYLWRRFSRLFPVYWVFLTIFIFAALLGIGPINFKITWVDLLSAYTLLRWITNPDIPLKVAWTLIFEVSFYIIFAIGILNRWAGVLIGCTWLFGIIVSSALGSLDMGYFSMWNINFFFGAAAWMLFRHIDRFWGVHLLAVGVICLVLLTTLDNSYISIETQQATPFSLLLIGIPFCFIVAGGALAEQSYGAIPNRFFLLLGDASYAIYLVHSAAISILCQIAHRFIYGKLPPELLFVVIFLVATLAGLIAHLMVERPILKMTRYFGQSFSVYTFTRRFFKQHV